MLLKKPGVLLNVSNTCRESFRSTSGKPSMAVATLLIETHPGAMSLEADDIEGPDEEGTETNKRSERKRQREKQRRSDLSNAFDELAAFVVQFVPEPGPGDTDLEGKKKRKKSPMAAMLIEDGLKMVEKKEAKPFTMADMLNIEPTKMSEDDIVNAVISGLNKK